MDTSTPVTQSVSAALPEDYTLRLCEQLARWRYEDLPAAVVRTLKFFLLDTLGVALAGARAEGSVLVRHYVESLAAGGAGATVIGSATPAPARSTSLSCSSM